MWKFKIEKVADTLVNQARLFNCSIEVAWNDYMHSLIKEQFTLDEVLNYLEDMEILKQLEQRMKNDNGVRYSLDDVRELINKRLNKENT